MTTLVNPARRCTALLSLLIALGAWSPARAMDYSVFHEPQLIRALLEEDIRTLTKGTWLEVLGHKVFGLEVYEHIAETCGGPSRKRTYVFKRLKWRYLADILAAPSKGMEVSRAEVLDRLGHAVDDARTLIDTLGCGSSELHRIVMETRNGTS